MADGGLEFNAQQPTDAKSIRSKVALIGTRCRTGAHAFLGNGEKERKPTFHRG